MCSNWGIFGCFPRLAFLNAALNIHVHVSLRDVFQFVGVYSTCRQVELLDHIVNLVLVLVFFFEGGV